MVENTCSFFADNSILLKYQCKIIIKLKQNHGIKCVSYVTYRINYVTYVM